MCVRCKGCGAEITDLEGQGEEGKTYWCSHRCREFYWEMQRDQWKKDLLDPCPSVIHREAPR